MSNLCRRVSWGCGILKSCSTVCYARIHLWLLWLYIAERMQCEKTHEKSSQRVVRRSFATGKAIGQMWLKKSEKVRWPAKRISSQWHWLGLRERMMVISQDPGDILDFETTYVDKGDKVDGVVRLHIWSFGGSRFQRRKTPILPGKRSLSLDTKESGVHTDRHCWTTFKIWCYFTNRILINDYRKYSVRTHRHVTISTAFPPLFSSISHRLTSIVSLMI